jgi:hypothetical protein
VDSAGTLPVLRAWALALALALERGSRGIADIAAYLKAILG